MDRNDPKWKFGSDEDAWEAIRSWVKRLVDGEIQGRLGSPDLEFAWCLEERMTLDEFRDILIKLIERAKQARLDKAALVDELDKHAYDLKDEIEEENDDT